MKKKGIKRTAVSLVTALIMVLTSVQMAFCCTNMYFGSETTENGSTFIGRSEDSGWSKYIKCYTVPDAEDHEAGAMYKSLSTGFEMPYPEHTYRYTLVKDTTDYPDLVEEEMAQAGTNEMGVAVSASVTLSGLKSEIKAVDPMVRGGLCEEDIPSVVLMQASTARQGAEALVNIYETLGAGGRDMTIIVDDKEAWVVQSLSGHVAAATLCPSNMVATTPNITANVPVTNDENTIASTNLYSVAEAAESLVTDADGNILVADSYAAKPKSMSKRLYNCYLYLKGEEFADSVEAATTEAGGQYIDYFLEPSVEKYSTYDVLMSLAYRGEGGKYYADSSTGNSIGIGNDNNLEVHMFESRKNMPYEMAVVQWESLGPVEFGCYIPGYNALITDTIEENKIGLDTMTYNYENPELNSFRTAYFELYFLCKGRDNQDGLTVGTGEARAKYGAGVKAFWEAYQKELIAQQPAIDAEMAKILAYDKGLAEQKATELNKHLQKECLGYVVQMVNELKAFESTPQEGDFVPSCMGQLPTYSFEAIGGTGLPEETVEPTQPTKPDKPHVTKPAKVKKASIKVKGTIKVKAKKNTKIKANKAFVVKSSKAVTYKKVSGNKKITVAKNGTITVKKGLKKGAVYKIKVKIKAPAGKGYSALSKTVTLKIKVK